MGGLVDWLRAMRLLDGTIDHENIPRMLERSELLLRSDMVKAESQSICSLCFQIHMVQNTP